MLKKAAEEKAVEAARAATEAEVKRIAAVKEKERRDTEEVGVRGTTHSDTFKYLQYHIYLSGQLFQVQIPACV